ncbi:hypothetical protein JTM72_32965, partial [Pseudomonas aeruginosa]|nr:hypothetical protein [Pseudomonas aeruginosa]
MLRILAVARLRLLLYDRNLEAKTISPALRAFLAGQILFASRRSTTLRPQAVQPARPPPIGSQQDAMGANPVQPKGNSSWQTSAPSPQRKMA